MKFKNWVYFSLLLGSSGLMSCKTRPTESYEISSLSVCNEAVNVKCANPARTSLGLVRVRQAKELYAYTEFSETNKKGYFHYEIVKGNDVQAKSTTFPARNKDVLHKFTFTKILPPGYDYTLKMVQGDDIALNGDRESQFVITPPLDIYDIVICLPNQLVSNQCATTIKKMPASTTEFYVTVVFKKYPGQKIADIAKGIQAAVELDTYQAGVNKNTQVFNSPQAITALNFTQKVTVPATMNKGSHIVSVTYTSAGNYTRFQDPSPRTFTAE